jgi:hypothetical protein
MVAQKMNYNANTAIMGKKHHSSRFPKKQHYLPKESNENHISTDTPTPVPTQIIYLLIFLLLLLHT